MEEEEEAGHWVDHREVGEGLRKEGEVGEEEEEGEEVHRRTGEEREVEGHLVEEVEPLLQEMQPLISAPQLNTLQEIVSTG